MRLLQPLKLVQKLTDELTWSSCIIFTATKRGTDQLERLLSKKGFNVASIHGDRSQDERTKALNAFKNGKVPIIVATDVLSRGIDIADVSLIINYDVPKAVEDYIHRIGRTGRYDKTGMAVTLVSKQDSRSFKAIQDKVGKDLEVIKGFGEARSSKHTSKKEQPKQDQKPVENKQNSKPIEPDFSKASSINVTRGESGQILIELKNKPKEEKQEKKEQPKKEPKAPKKQQSQKKDKSQPKKDDRNTPEKQKKPNKKNQQKEPKYVIRKVEKAVERNQNTRKPAKGFWGVIKSMLPKFGD